MPQATNTYLPDAAAAEKQILEDIELQARDLGIDVPPTGPGTHLGLTAKALANVGSIVISNVELYDNDVDPTRAEDEALNEIRVGDGLPALEPTPGYGTIKAIAYGVVSIPAGLEFQAPGGFVGRTMEYRRNTQPIQAELSFPFKFKTPGATGLSRGTQVRFNRGPLNLATSGNIVELVDGTDVESNEHMRDRVMNRRQNPVQGGNWSQLRETALNVPGVDDAYVHPGLGGSGTSRIVLLKNATSSDYSREVPDSVLTEARATFAEKYPTEAARFSIVSAVDSFFDVIIYLNLPIGSAQRWTDVPPWPEVPLRVSSVGVEPNQNRITLADIAGATRAHAAPSAQKRIVLWSVAEQQAYRGTVSEVLSATQFDVVWDDSFPTGPQIGDWFFPDAPNILGYIDVFVASLAQLGSGENTADPVRLRRAYRHPVQGASVGGVVIGQPWSVSSTQSGAIQSAYPEISDLSYMYLSTSEPPIPGSVKSPPGVLRLRNLGFSTVK